MERVEALAVPGQWAAASLDPPPGLLGRYLEPDDDVAAQRLPNPLRVHRTTAERDYPTVRVLEDSLDLRGLETSKLLLATAPEEGDDRHAELLLEDVVGIDRVQAGGARGVGSSRLPRSHEADEDDRGAAARGASLLVAPPLYRRQPIRSL